MKFEVHAAHSLHCKQFDDDTCVISIVSPGADHPSIVAQHIIRLRFHDVDKPIPKIGGGTYYPMADNDARKIVEFFKQHQDKQRCIVHCEAGISRSPAVAIALSEAVDGTPCAEALIERYPTFNRHVYRAVWQALQTPILSEP